MLTDTDIILTAFPPEERRGDEEGEDINSTSKAKNN